jgi:starch-binding outer membrane protein, SusD/RagB family
MKTGTLIALSVLGCIIFSSCEKMLDTSSDRVMTEDEYGENATSDTLYSMLGILTKLQAIADRYVVLGEMRGDLTDVTPYTENALRDLANFNVSNDNVYANIRDFYVVINNCNVVLAHLDTAIIRNGQKVLRKEFAAIKGIRAWTYLQLVLNFKEVPYYTKPLLTVEDTKEDFPKLNLPQMIDTLIRDIESYVNDEYPNFGNIGVSPNPTINTPYLFIPIKMVLGDLCLWKGDFDRAAYYYYSLIIQKGYTTGSHSCSYTNENFTSVNTSTWRNIFTNSREVTEKEIISLVAFSSSGATGKVTKLNDLFGSYTQQQISGSKRWLTIASEQRYAYGTLPDYTYGDLRVNGSTQTNSYNQDVDYPMVTKFASSNVILYRSGLLYLRLAEAANRAGNPGFAFAILKYGLNAANATYVPQRELAKNLTYINFSSMGFGNTNFNSNRGINYRGCGESQFNAEYAIPGGLQTNADSVLVVEDLISNELAMEMAFEGNRFPDLMRFSLRRNSPDYLASKVAERSGTRDVNLYNKLLNMENWYLPIVK